jgi:hypothetical protein
MEKLVRAVSSGDIGMKSRFRKESRRWTIASNDKPLSCGWVDGNEIDVFWKEKFMDRWCSWKAPTEIRLIGASGACRQFFKVQRIVQPSISIPNITSPIARVVREPQFAVLTGTTPAMS